MCTHRQRSSVERGAPRVCNGRHVRSVIAITADDRGGVFSDFARATGVLPFADLLPIDDRVAVDAEEHRRIEPLLERRQGHVHEMPAGGRVDPHVIVLRLDPDNLVGAHRPGRRQRLGGGGPAGRRATRATRPTARWHTRSFSSIRSSWRWRGKRGRSKPGISTERAAGATPS
jgi:hypothetical protein